MIEVVEKEYFRKSSVGMWCNSCKDGTLSDFQVRVGGDGDFTNIHLCQDCANKLIGMLQGICGECVHHRNNLECNEGGVSRYMPRDGYCSDFDRKYE